MALSSLATALDEMAHTIKAPHAIEGLSVRGNEIVLLASSPATNGSSATHSGMASR
jgi:hypothetical protein